MSLGCRLQPCGDAAWWRAKASVAAKRSQRVVHTLIMLAERGIPGSRDPGAERLGNALAGRVARIDQVDDMVAAKRLARPDDRGGGALDRIALALVAGKDRPAYLEIRPAFGRPGAEAADRHPASALLGDPHTVPGGRPAAGDHCDRPPCFLARQAAPLTGDETRETIVGISAHKRVAIVRAMAAQDEAPRLEDGDRHLSFIISAAPGCALSRAPHAASGTPWERLPPAEDRHGGVERPWPRPWRSGPGTARRPSRSGSRRAGRTRSEGL